MREIKFRAKATQDYDTDMDSIEKGDWVYGFYYFCRRRESGIIVTTLQMECGGVGSGLVQVEVEVDYKTRAQYIGLKAKKGRKVYEGDIISNQHRKQRIVIEFKDGAFCYKVEQIWGGYKYFNVSQLGEYDEIIGDIYTTPDLKEQS